MSTMQESGKLISIEGGEGAGKTTVLNAVKGFFEQRGFVVTTTREPGGTPLGEKVRELLLDPGNSICTHAELLLMFASRAQLVSGLIKPELAKGHVVLTDRFTDASFAYQGGGRGIAEADIAELERRYVGLKPDLTLLLDIGVEQGLARAHARGQGLDRIEQEQAGFFLGVRAAYLNKAAQEPERIRIIDASQPADAVVTQVLAVLQAWLKR
jgi:dTMP kinase